LGIVVALFLSFRLMLLMAYPVDYLTHYGDYMHYFNLARLTDKGFYPYLHYWCEFPPLFPLLSISIYRAIARLGLGFTSYATALALVMLGFELGNLVLIYLLARLLYGHKAWKVAGLYSLLLPPLLFACWTFEPMVLFFSLLAFYWFLRGREVSSALILGLGAMTKYTPFLFLAPVWRYSSPGRALRYTLIVLLICLLVLGPLFVRSPDYTLASLAAQPCKSSWETVWALIDGNYDTGNFGPIRDRFVPSKAFTPLHNPSRIPWWLTTLAFGLVYLYFFFYRRMEKRERAILRLAGLTLVLFFLWAKGWSPQWQLLLIPFILLMWPDRRGVLYVLTLGFINLLEWPVLLSRGLAHLLPVTVLARTMVFILLLFDFHRSP